MAKKYMAYVGSYSYTGDAEGITVYDVDEKLGLFHKRCEVSVDNSSYVIVSHNQKTLYSIADEGVVAFSILSNGGISRLNSANIKGMRGCHLSTDPEDKYIFVSGFHDGKVTVLSLKPDGRVGNILDGVYHKGLGSVAERNFRPHVSCTKMTPDGHFVMAADLGIDQVKIYRFNKESNELELRDALRCEMNSAPRCFRFSNDGRFMYLMYEMKNVIDVYTYSYNEGDRAPSLEKIQTVSTTGKIRPNSLTAATSIEFTKNQDYMFISNAGDNSVCMYKRDAATGLLEYSFCLPISGEYPKDVALFPDGKHLASVNHESGTITFFDIDYEKNLLIMNCRSEKVNQPNCCVIVEV